jgi:hypothetical protein
MTHCRLFLISVLIFFGTLLSLRAEEVIKTKKFVFDSNESHNSKKTERFCLPLEERLVEVKGVFVEQSNSKADINITPDLNSNCININVDLPPASSVCTEIPQVSGFPPRVTNKRLCQSVPTTLHFSVNYESRPAVAQREEVSEFRITINKVVLRDTGHKNSRVAEVFFVVRQGGRVVPTPGLPSNEQSDAWLRLSDDVPISPDNLAFIISGGHDQQILIELWDHDSPLWQKDDLLAQFALRFKSSQTFPIEQELDEIHARPNDKIKSTITVGVQRVSESK